MVKLILNLLQQRTKVPRLPWALPEGEYEFYNFSMIMNEREFWYSKQEYSIPFQVSANEITYLGEIMAHPSSEADFLGGTENVRWLLDL